MFPVSETFCPPTSRGNSQNCTEVKPKLRVGLLLSLCGREQWRLISQGRQRSGLAAANSKNTCTQPSVCTWKPASLHHSLEAQKGYCFDSESPGQAKSRLYKTMPLPDRGMFSICCGIKNTVCRVTESHLDRYILRKTFIL